MDGHKTVINIIQQTKMENTKKPEVKAIELNHTQNNSKAGDWSSSEWTVDLTSLTREDVDNLIDSNSIEPVCAEIIRSWHSVKDAPLSESSIVPEWMKNPTVPSQIEAIVTPPAYLDGNKFKKAFDAIDLEHRKVTEDENGKVAVEEIVKDEKGNVVPKGYDKNGIIPLKRWTKDGESLFRNRKRSRGDLYNFAAFAVRNSKGVEKQFDANRQKAKDENYIIVRQKKNKGRFIEEMISIKEVNIPKVTVKGKQYDADEVAAMIEANEKLQAEAENIKNAAGNK